ncbi:AAA family ATPase [Anabaena cylindrica FACHB-243]|uniref:ATPase n=1 Tax=Anabaena cylindrica (strain ATCC 27899 / PCC 7122) TaxID=272123 RepID=K9ZP73_ANACC|nr:MULTISPECIES: AAA family ATPase [Anabaena]AFZ60125.1 ATPase [Anabaena cylindrica PCC 7122]MBD2417820.1 AAA family ATPase [Anabaena cylindrica FACHB-243]MBY5285278.1 AAA family ATPase [Anabaena sp. CCAP 1446/1C]MBY5307987.1 AAA family ATPase [Anabaena sp. CCAP 1446/1C]MCM2404735.1 AAA family ATPase [Anabaena sp. CCAP 1446/1C]
MTIKLTTAKIENFKSLGDISLSFRDLTMIVGSNSSGKSNSLESLNFFKHLLVSDSLSLETIQTLVRLGKEKINLKLIVEDDEHNQAEYNVCLKTNKKNVRIATEILKVNEHEVIKVINGEGEVRDEDGQNSQSYKSDPESIESLALRYVGNIGNKPFTKKLASYIRDWKFYNIDPDDIRKYSLFMERIKLLKTTEDNDRIPNLDNEASEIQEVLNYWAKNDRNRINEITEELQSCLNISLNLVGKKDPIVNVLELDGKQMPLSSMSDGTLRLIAYLTLLYQSDSDMPSLIGIEEPEMNFHPGILKDVASIMKRLSKRTQVVLTTHSSQLLDCFSPEEISSDISIILLSQKGELGTRACLLDQLAENRDDLLDWMTDFGLGSAIYHSHLIEEILAS